MTDLRRLRAAIRPYLLLYIDVYQNTEMVGYEHDTIVDAVVSGNDAVLETCMREHVMSAAKGVLDFLRSGRGRRANVRAKKRLISAIP